MTTETKAAAEALIPQFEFQKVLNQGIDAGLGLPVTKQHADFAIRQTRMTGVLLYLGPSLALRR